MSDETPAALNYDDDDGEDLPDNFFDDLEGLDIVDDWNDDDDDKLVCAENDSCTEKTDDLKIATKSIVIKDVEQKEKEHKSDHEDVSKCVNKDEDNLKSIQKNDSSISDELEGEENVKRDTQTKIGKQINITLISKTNSQREIKLDKANQNKSIETDNTKESVDTDTKNTSFESKKLCNDSKSDNEKSIIKSVTNQLDNTTCASKTVNIVSESTSVKNKSECKPSVEEKEKIENESKLVKKEKVKTDSTKKEDLILEKRKDNQICDEKEKPLRSTTTKPFSPKTDDKKGSKSSLNNTKLTKIDDKSKKESTAVKKDDKSKNESTAVKTDDKSKKESTAMKTDDKNKKESTAVKTDDKSKKESTAIKTDDKILSKKITESSLINKTKPVKTEDKTHNSNSSKQKDEQVSTKDTNKSSQHQHNKSTDLQSSENNSIKSRDESNNKSELISKEDQKKDVKNVKENSVDKKETHMRDRHSREEFRRERSSREKYIVRARSKSRDRPPINHRSPRHKSRERDRSRNRYERYKRTSDKREEDFINRRRDPEKTRRDIQRDKIRCEKDEKEKVLKEQVKVAESGLVPPGMELEAVMQKKDNSHNRFKQRSPVVRRSWDRECSRRDNSNRDSYRNNSPYSHSSFSKRNRNIRDTSPISDTHFSRSPIKMDQSPKSVVSERELWLTKREHYKRRSCSMVSSNSLSDHSSPKRKHPRTSFIEEIDIKMRERPAPFITQQNQPAVDIYQHQLQMQIHQQQQQQHQMNYSNPVFGTNVSQPTFAQSFVPNPNAMQANLMDINVNQYLPSQPQSQPLPVPPPTIDVSQFARSYQMYPLEHGLENRIPDENQQVDQNKSFDLSEYYNVSPKPIDSGTSIKDILRMKAIKKCMDANHLLSDNGLLSSGRFFLKKVPVNQNTSVPVTSSKLTTPLRKLNVSKFRFTSFAKKEIETSQLHQTLVRMMNILGLKRLQVPPSVTTPPIISQQTTLTTTPAVKKHEVTMKNKETSTTPVQCVTIFSQTEPWKCRACESRAAIRHVNASVQCNEEEQRDVSTQVSIDDLNKSCATFTPRGILKNSTSLPPSLSHMTSAQLLAMQNEETGHKEFFRSPQNYGKPPTPTPLLASPSPLPTFSTPHFENPFGPDSNFKNTNPRGGVSYRGRAGVRGSPNQRFGYQSRPYFGRGKM